MSQIVILAGGLGTRLGSLTREIPKPMVLVAGKPFLEWQVRFFLKQGHQNFLFLTGYKGHLIEEYFGGGQEWGAQFSYLREDKPLGTGGALSQASSFLESEFLLMFGDSFLPVVANQILEGLRKPETLVVMSVYDNAEDTSVPFNVQIQDGLVTRYEKADTTVPHNLRYVEAGVYAVKRSVIEDFGGQNSQTQVSFETHILKNLIREKRVAAWLSPSRFFDIGTPERLRFFEGRVHDYF